MLGAYVRESFDRVLGVDVERYRDPVNDLGGDEARLICSMAGAVLPSVLQKSGNRLLIDIPEVEATAIEPPAKDADDSKSIFDTLRAIATLR